MTDDQNTQPEPEATEGKHVAEQTREDYVQEREAGVEMPDNADVEPGDEPQPESDDGRQDDPDADPVTEPEPSDRERDELGE